MSNSTHPSNLDNLKELLDQLDQEYNATYRSPDAIAALVKTIKSFNITITDWNTLVEYISVLGSSMRALVKTVPEIAGLIAPMYGYVDLESDQDVKGLKDFKDGIKIGTAPTNDADATTKLYVDTNLQNVREVAEGKCKTLVLDYAMSITESSFGSSTVKTETGEVLESYQDFLDYIGDRSLGNALLNSVEQSVSAGMSDYYFVEQDPYNQIYTIYTEFSAYNTGDILLIIETNVPDRWLRFVRYPQYNINTVNFYKLDISKLDVQNIPDHVYVTTENKPSGLSYGLRIRNNGWTSDIQQEGGAKLELTGTAVNVTATNGVNTSAINSASTLGLFGYVGTNTTGFTLGNGIIQANRSITPTINGGRDLGSNTIRWGTVYAGKTDGSGGLDLGNGMKVRSSDAQGSYMTLHQGDAQRMAIGPAVYSYVDVIPGSNGQKNLGSSSMVWSYIYVNNLSNGSGDITSHCNFKPSANNSLDLGSSSLAWKDLYLSGEVNFSTSGVTTLYHLFENASEQLEIGRTYNNIYATLWLIDGRDFVPKGDNENKIGSSSKRISTVYTYGIHSGGGNFTLQVGSNIEIYCNQNAYMFPNQDGYLYLGKSDKRFSAVYTSKIANDFSALQITGKSGISFSCNDGSAISPSSDAKITLGAAGRKYLTTYTRYLNDDSVNVAVSNIAQKGFEPGEGTAYIHALTLDANGEATMDLEFMALTPGLYWVTYANAQTFIIITDDLINLSATGDAIRAPIPVVYDYVNKYTVPGMLKIWKNPNEGTQGFLHIKISDGNHNAAQNLQVRFYKTKLA